MSRGRCGAAEHTAAVMTVVWVTRSGIMVMTMWCMRWVMVLVSARGIGVWSHTRILKANDDISGVVWSL